MNFTERLFQETDVRSFYGQHTKLRKLPGKPECEGLCPLHEEKTPSFFVNIDSGSFKCFGCGKGGGPVQFEAKRLGISTEEACRRLAQEYGIGKVSRKVAKTQRQERKEEDSPPQLRNCEPRTANRDPFCNSLPGPPPRRPGRRIFRPPQDPGRNAGPLPDRLPARAHQGRSAAGGQIQRRQPEEAREGAWSILSKWLKDQTEAAEETARGANAALYLLDALSREMAVSRDDFEAEYYLGCTRQVSELGKTTAVSLEASSKQLLRAFQKTKSRKARYVPLSDFAVEWLRSLVRVMDRPEVFICMRTRRPWRDPREAFAAGKKKAGLNWVGLHDLRHFRATQWVMQGSTCAPSRSCWATPTSRRRCATPTSTASTPLRR